MYYILERIQKTCNEIKNYVYTNKLSINDYKMLEGNYLGMEGIKQAKGEWKEFHTGDLWGDLDSHCWFKTQIKVPENFFGKVIALNFIIIDR